MRITIDVYDGEGNKTGERDATIAELKVRAKRSDATGRKAILDLIDIKGGFSNLTAAHKDKLLKWMILPEEGLNL